MSIVDFMSEKTEYEFYDGSFSLKNGEETIYVIIPDKGTYEAAGGYEIRDILERELNKEIRFCDVCGEPMDHGFICGDGFWYADEEHFKQKMDEEYGVDCWRLNDSGEEGENGGYYDHLVNGEWEDTGVFYTEWY